MKSIMQWMEENDMGTDMNFKNVMGGSSTIEPDFRMKSLLRNKIEQIVKESQKKNMNSIQIFQALIATVLSLMTELTGSKISLGKAIEELKNLDNNKDDKNMRPEFGKNQDVEM